MNAKSLLVTTSLIGVAIFALVSALIAHFDTQAVPGPDVGAGLPGLILACAALLGLARRRRASERIGVNPSTFAALHLLQGFSSHRGREADLRGRVLKEAPTLADSGDSVMTPEQKAKRHKYYIKRRTTLTPEQLEAERAYQRQYARKRRAAMTPEQVGAYNAYQREHQHKRWASMTPEELDAKRARKREYERKRHATVLPCDAARK